MRLVKIPLTRGKIALVDKEFSHLSNWKWHAIIRNGIWYAAHNFSGDDGWKGRIRMHQAIIGRSLNRQIVIDHRNGDGLLNSQKNLRHATNRENISNQKRKIRQKTSSGFVGVYWHKASKKWLAQIIVNKKKTYIGIYSSEKEASKAYQKALALYKEKQRGK